MTNEEAIKMLKSKMDGHTDTSYEWAETVRMAIKALEQQPCIQEKQANADKIDAVYIDGFKAGYSQARFDLEQEPCDDAISKQAVLDTISELNAISFYEAQEDSKECYYEIKQAVENIQSVTPQQKRGHWIYTGDYLTEGMLKCSECGEEIDVSESYYDFCPVCGAKMVEPQESEEQTE